MIYRKHVIKRGKKVILFLETNNQEITDFIGNED